MTETNNPINDGNSRQIKLSSFFNFGDCVNLTALDLSSFDTANVTDMESMFSNCRNLTTTSTIRGTKCTKYTRMFYDAHYYSTASITLNYTEDASSLCL